MCYYDVRFSALLLWVLGTPCFLVAASPEARETGTLTWHDDYTHAYSVAAEAKKLLLVNFVPTEPAEVQSQVEDYIATHPEVQRQLAACVLVRVPSGSDLHAHRAFAELGGSAGFVVVDLAHEDKPYTGRVVSAFPFASGKYYRWRPAYLPAMLVLPAGTLTQRTMVWAVRSHADHPESTDGEVSEVLLEAAGSHSAYQARIGVQGHHQFSTRSSQLRGQLGTGGTMSEVVAQSWSNQSMIDSCIDAVKSWRHSSGHWGQVRRRHTFYGYDIRLGRNGTWYATGIFSG